MDASLRARAEQLVEEFAGQATTAADLNGFMQLMMKTALERMLNTELDVHLGRKGVAPPDAEVVTESPSPSEPAKSSRKQPLNRRNGHSSKKLQGDLGELTIATPRDRQGTFEPLVIPKHQRRIPGFDEKILALYTKGMTTRDIQEIIKSLYDVEITPSLISEIAGDLEVDLVAWQTRSLASVWPIVYFDGFVVYVRGENARVSQHTVYVALGVNLEGHKELLGLWLSQNEGAKFWLSCMTDLKNRGLNDIFIVCIDGLSG